MMKIGSKQRVGQTPHIVGDEIIKRYHGMVSIMSFFSMVT
jgi:hypothetical protein